MFYRIPQNMEIGTPVAVFENINVARWNQMVQNLVRSNPGELRLIDLENTFCMTDHLLLTRDGNCFITLQERRWINDAFQLKIEELGEELIPTDSLAQTNLTCRGKARSIVSDLLNMIMGANGANPSARN